MSAPNKGGRPRMYEGRVRPITVTLDAETIRRGKELGAGNLSVGIRKALSTSPEGARSLPKEATEGQ